MRIAFSIALSAAVWISPLSAQKLDFTAPDRLELFSDTDAEMNAAVSQAQATLPLFLTAVLGEDNVAMGGSLKVTFQTFPEDVGQEIIWVGDFRRTEDGSFVGYLNNQPVNLGDWELGHEVTFILEDIQDWSLEGEEGLWGNYTTRVIAAQPGNDHLWGILAEAPIPPDWE